MSTKPVKNSKELSKCCRCNGVNARCKFCACAKANRACTSCQPSKVGCCHNVSSALKPHPTALLIIDSPTGSTSTTQSLVLNTSTPSDLQQLLFPQPLPQPTSNSPLVSRSSSPPRSRLDLESVESHCSQQQPNIHIGSTYTSMCCECNGPKARCISCKCCHENRACINCFPGEHGKCVNIVNIVSSTTPQTTKTGSVRALPSWESSKVAACVNSMSSSTQALIPSPLEVNHQQPISPSSQLSNLPLPVTTQPPTRRIYAPFQSSTRTPRPKKSAWSRTVLSSWLHPCGISICPYMPVDTTPARSRVRGWRTSIFLSALPATS